MIEAKHYVYEWFIKETGEIFYVGKGSGNRVISKKNRNNYFKNIIKKYECDYRILKYFEKEDDAYNYELERGLELKSIGQAKACYMLGNINRYIDFSVIEKTKKTQFKTGHTSPFKGIKRSEDFREKCRKRQTGKIHSEVTKARMSASRMGHKVSDKAIASLVERNSKKVYRINQKTNQIDKVYEAAKFVADEFNVSRATITHICKSGKIWRGYIFTYNEHGNPESV
jgi:hypothetical protein